jgi:hypothetical protein
MNLFGNANVSAGWQAKGAPTYLISAYASSASSMVWALRRRRCA